MTEAGSALLGCGHLAGVVYRYCVAQGGAL